MTRKKKPDLLQDPVGTVLWRMTLPVIGGMASMMLFNMVDAYFVGQLGTAELAAVSFTFPVTFAVISLAIGLGIGTSAVVARRLGQGDQALVRRRATDAWLLAALVALIAGLLGWFSIEPLFTLLGADAALLPLIRDYMGIWYLGSLFLIVPRTISSSLRASGNTLIPGLVMIAAGLFNGLLDPLLIFGLGPFPALGVQGAALATVIAWGCMTLGLALQPAVRHELLSREWPSVRDVWASWRELGRIALPAAASNVMTPVSAALLTKLVASFGAAAVAAFGVGSRIESLSLLVTYALTMTLPPVISQNYGAGQLARARGAVVKVLLFVMVWQGLVYLGLLLAQRQVVGAFGTSPEVAQYLTWYLWLVPLAFGCQGVVVLINSTMNALHQPMMAVGLSILRLFVFYVPSCWLGSQLAGMWGLFAGVVVAYLLMSLVSFAVFRWRFRRLAGRMDAEAALDMGGSRL